jgi:hypothetical protein
MRREYGPTGAKKMRAGCYLPARFVTNLLIEMMSYDLRFICPCPVFGSTGTETCE